MQLFDSVQRSNVSNFIKIQLLFTPGEQLLTHVNMNFDTARNVTASSLLGAATEEEVEPARSDA